MQKFQPKTCSDCHQRITYLLPVDKGTADIVRAIYNAITRKGENRLHPRNEMEVSHSSLDRKTLIREGLLTSNQVGNLSRARFHGLIAAEGGGYYCLTNKGSRFLRGEAIPKYAIIDKSEKKQVGYFLDNEDYVTIYDFLDADEYWEIKNLPVEKVDYNQQLIPLFNR